MSIQVSNYEMDKFRAIIIVIQAMPRIQVGRLYSNPRPSSVLCGTLSVRVCVRMLVCVCVWCSYIIVSL